MKSTNPLIPVYDAFCVARHCFDVAADIIGMREKAPADTEQMLAAEPTITMLALEHAERQAADLAIFALFATFERFVIEHVQAANHLLAAGHPPAYADRLAEKFENEVEYWRFAEILNLFKREIDADLIGRIKQIKQYRDWIAHRNPNKPVPMETTPEMTFDTLTQMISVIQLTHVAAPHEAIPTLDPITV